MPPRKPKPGGKKKAPRPAKPAPAARKAPVPAAKKATTARTRKKPAPAPEAKPASPVPERTKAPVPAPAPTRPPAAPAAPVSPAAASRPPERPAARAVPQPPRMPNGPVDLRPAAPPVLGDIPWAYGDNRITAMARDPHWAYAYWEVSDEAIATARGRTTDPMAGLALRVYDSTHREFNGLNAHHSFDLGVDRATTSYTFRIGRPGSTIHVDIGVRAVDGTYVPIARSSAVGMPRDSVSPDTRAEWSTVLRSGPGYAYHHRFVAPPAPPPAPPGEPAAWGAAAPSEFERVFQHLAGEGWTRNEWTETLMDGRVVRWIRWMGPFVPEQFPLIPMSASAPFKHVEVLFQGERRVIRLESGEKTVFGPWRIVLEAVGSKGERRTIHQWAVRHRWTTEQGGVRVETPAILTRILGGRRLTAARSGSDERLAREAWGSELLQAGASEWRWIGASESLAAGSSETLQLGSTETLFLGASERSELGGSELRWGASEQHPGGASERSFQGSSEDRP
ncbi:MAG TPA: DUF4912 domain-containing protein [Planctomycetota bacterium]|nr:DUF4912 domain-containing protein [Planctomycetota bacterium]